MKQPNHRPACAVQNDVPQQADCLDPLPANILTNLYAYSFQGQLTNETVSLYAPVSPCKTVSRTTGTLAHLSTVTPNP